MNVLAFLTAGLPGFVLDTAITWAVALVVTRRWIRPAADGQTMVLHSLVIALGVATVFGIPGLVLGGVLRGLLWGMPGLVLGAVLSWVVAGALIDRLYDVPFRETHGHIAQILVPSLLLWYLSGYAIAWVFGG
ncbi:MAG: hypothetical protein ACYDCO_26790 [Armatimonadota bacterium]